MKAREISENSVFSKDPDEWLEEVEKEEFFRSVDAHATDKGVIRRKIDRAVHHGTYQVHYMEVVSVPLWNTPEERERNDSYSVIHKSSTRGRDLGPQEEIDEPRDRYQESIGEIMRGVHADFSGRMALMYIAVASMYSFVGKPYEGLEKDPVLSPGERRQALNSKRVTPLLCPLSDT